MKIESKDLGIAINAPALSERIYVPCPICKDNHANHAKKRCLKVNTKTGVYYCYRCEAKGRLADMADQPLPAPQEKVKQEWAKPAWCAEFINAPSEALTYLVEQRHLSPDTLKALKVSEPWIDMPPREEDSFPHSHRPLSQQADSSPISGEQLRGGSATTGSNPETGVTPAITADAAESNPKNGEQKKKWKLEQVIAFNYFLDGELVNIKYRSTDKRFLSFKGGRVIPYNIDSLKGKNVCAITEGEIDALTLHECGIKSVISVPTGGNSRVTWIDEFWDTHFADKAFFILALDNDTVGQQLRDALVQRLGADKCRVVQWSKDCKDANEQLCRHGRKSVVSRVERAVHPLMENVYTANDLEGDLQDVFNNRIQHGKRIGLQGFDELVSFETGRLVIESGRPGDGKSELADEIIVRLNLLHGWKTAYFSPENVPIALHLRKLAEKITGYRFEPSKEMNNNMYEAVQRWLANNIFHILPREDRYELDTILETAQMLVERKGIKVLVIDPFNRIEQRLSEGQTELQYISSMLNRLIRFAQQTDVMVLLVAHPRKVNRNSTDGRARRVEMNDINGSSDFGNKADICLIVDRNDEAGVTTVHVDKVRFKHLGKRGQCLFHYDVINGRFNPCGMGRALTKDGGWEMRFSDVQWQTQPWIMPDGSLLPPLLPNGNSSAPLLHNSNGAAPPLHSSNRAAPPRPADIAQQTIPFS